MSFAASWQILMILLLFVVVPGTTHKELLLGAGFDFFDVFLF